MSVDNSQKKKLLTTVSLNQRLPQRVPRSTFYHRCTHRMTIERSSSYPAWFMYYTKVLKSTWGISFIKPIIFPLLNFSSCLSWNLLRVFVSWMDLVQKNLEELQLYSLSSFSGANNLKSTQSCVKSFNVSLYFVQNLFVSIKLSRFAVSFSNSAKMVKSLMHPNNRRKCFFFFFC